MLDKYEVLKETFGFESFRDPQGEIIDSIFDRNNNEGILVVMPTGGGKSLLYQIPSLLMDGLTIVVSPLISLMKNQIDYLKSKNVCAEFYNSSLTESEKKAIYLRLTDQQIKILYVAPERFGDQKFTEVLKMTNKISLFAIDESHCISSWGHDFRPSYRMLSNIIEFLEPQQVIALTATATRRVQKDICKQLNIPKATKFIKGFYRPDLSLSVKTCNSVSKIDHIIKKTLYHVNSGVKTGIVYTPTRKTAEVLCTKLQNEGVNSTLYHAGLTDELRESTQTNWFKDGGIIVATVAFGMGIDKADVRFVIHAGMPASVENYYQEIGRASRDGNGAECIIYFDVFQDVNLQKFFIEMSYPPREIITEFWKWCRSKADKTNTISMTQKEMGEACKPFMKDFYISGCVSKLRENGFIETVGRGKYKINKDINIQKTFNFDSLEEKRKARFDTLNEMSDFVNNNKTCRMLQILEYFDDYSRTASCGKCDICIRKMLKNRPVNTTPKEN